MTALDRFWAKVSRTATCWLWTGAVSDHYGRVNWAGRTAYPHRVAWEIEHGPIAPGLLVCHRCDNPLCVRVGHLFLGTSADNAADMVTKGRASRVPRMVRRKLTLEKANEIRALRAAGIKRAALAAQFNVSISLVDEIVGGRCWKVAS